MAAAAAGYAAPEQLENVDVAIKRPAETWRKKFAFGDGGDDVFILF